MNQTKGSIEKPVSRTKSLITGCLVILLLSLIGGVIIVTRYQKMNSCYSDRQPLRSFAVTIETNQSQQLKEQLQKFADKNRFWVGTAYTYPNKDDFILYMQRKDVEVIAGSPFNPAGYKIVFYSNDCIHPTVVAGTDDLVIDLKSFLGEIPNLTVIEKK